MKVSRRELLKQRKMPNGATCETAQNAELRGMPNSSKCRTAQDHALADSPTFQSYPLPLRRCHARRPRHMVTSRALEFEGLLALSPTDCHWVLRAPLKVWWRTRRYSSV